MYRDNKEIFKNIETSIRNNEIKNSEELKAYLFDLKNRGILTQAQINVNGEELLKLFERKNPERNELKRMATRAPQRRDYQGSEGFSKLGFLVFIMMSFALLGIMLTLINQ